jgi:hypothetical protein
MRVMRKAVFVAAAGLMAVLGIAASPASAAARITARDPYPVPQSPAGVPNAAAIDITGAGFSPGSFVYAQLCDGLAPSSPNWTAQADCGPATAAVKVEANGKAAFPGSDPSFAIKIWHGDNANDNTLGEQQFNCLAPNDDPKAAVTTEGGQPIDSREPAWGSSKGGGSAGGGSAPCQIRLTTSLGVYNSSDLFDPINLTTNGASAAASSGATGSSGSGSSGSGSSGSSGAGSSSGASAAGGSGGQTSSGQVAASGDSGHTSSGGGLFGGSLAQTGAEIAGMVIFALALIAAGILLVRTSRRRRLQRT